MTVSPKRIEGDLDSFLGAFQDMVKDLKLVPEDRKEEAELLVKEATAEFLNENKEMFTPDFLDELTPQSMLQLTSAMTLAYTYNNFAFTMDKTIHPELTKIMSDLKIILKQQGIDLDKVKNPMTDLSEGQRETIKLEFKKLQLSLSKEKNVALLHELTGIFQKMLSNLEKAGLYKPKPGQLKHDAERLAEAAMDPNANLTGLAFNTLGSVAIHVSVYLGNGGGIVDYINNPTGTSPFNNESTMTVANLIAVGPGGETAEILRDQVKLDSAMPKLTAQQ